MFALALRWLRWRTLGIDLMRSKGEKHMRQAVLCALSTTFLTVIGAGNAGAVMPNGLTSAAIAQSVVIEDVAARAKGMGGGGGMAGGMGGMAGGMGGMAGGMAGGMGAAGMGAAGMGANLKNTNVKNTNIRNTNVKNTNVNVVAPVRAWAPRPYYGTIIAGATLGTVIAATTIGAVPAAPAPNLCWIWADQAMTRGYWDYCVPPP